MRDRTIWKFQGFLSTDVELWMPGAAEVLHAQVTRESMGRTLTVWAIVDPEASYEMRRFTVRGTGHPLGDVGHHVATTIDGPFVWHIFEGAS